MKKALSLILVAIMLMTTVAFGVSAYIDEGALCSCYNHVDNNTCKCCLYCKNLDTSYINECCKKDELNGKEVWIKCCNLCSGLENCSCDCTCCAKNNETLDDGSGSIFSGAFLDSFVDGFQNAMKKIQKVFDDFFDTIFDFLKIEDFFG